MSRYFGKSEELKEFQCSINILGEEPKATGARPPREEEDLLLASKGDLYRILDIIHPSMTIVEDNQERLLT